MLMNTNAVVIFSPCGVCASGTPALSVSSLRPVMYPPPTPHPPLHPLSPSVGHQGRSCSGQRQDGWGKEFTFLKRLIDMQCSPAFPVCRSHIPPQPACLLPKSVCVCVCAPGSLLMVMECCLCTVCMDSSPLPEDGGGDPTGEAVIVKSCVNRGSLPPAPARR